MTGAWLFGKDKKIFDVTESLRKHLTNPSGLLGNSCSSFTELRLFICLILNISLQAAEEEDPQNANDDASSASGSTSGPDFNYILNMSLWSLTKEKVEELIKHRDSKVGMLLEAYSEMI